MKSIININKSCKQRQIHDNKGQDDDFKGRDKCTGASDTEPNFCNLEGGKSIDSKMRIAL